jgi:hypothetical protein
MSPCGALYNHRSGQKHVKDEKGEARYQYKETQHGRVVGKTPNISAPKGSDGGLLRLKLLHFWALSVVWYSRKNTTGVATFPPFHMRTKTSISEMLHSF